MFEFTWYEKGIRKHKLVSEEEHANFWGTLNKRLIKKEIKFPFCKFIPGYKPKT